MSHDERNVMEPAGSTPPAAVLPSRARRVPGVTGRIGAVAGTGAILLYTGLAGAGQVLAGGWQPPWVDVAAIAMAALAAVAGMAVAAKLAFRPGRQLPAAVQTARVTAAGEVAAGAGGQTAGDAAAADASQGGTSPAARLEWLQIDARDGKRIIAAEAVRWIEASGNYARLHTADGSFLYRKSLAALEQVLDPALFVRVHRSAMVNLSAVHRLRPLAGGDADLELASGQRVRVSRRYAARLHARTGRPSGGRS